MTGVKGDFLVKAITMVVLILGLLKFAKEAPELFKSLFSRILTNIFIFDSSKISTQFLIKLILYSFKTLIKFE